MLAVITIAAAVAPPAVGAGPRVGTPLTPEQAGRLSGALYRDYLQSGARLQVEIPARSGTPRRLSGRIDWHLHLATATLNRPLAPSEAARMLLWSPSTVLEGGVPGLASAVRAAGHPGAVWVASRLTPTTSAFDSVLALLNGLASTKPENPLLLQQGKARYLGLSPIDGRRLEGYRSGSLTFWLSADGTIRRVSARVNAYGRPVQIDLLHHGRERIPVPAKAAVVAITAVPLLQSRLARTLR